MNPVFKKWSPEGDLETPYQKARQEWDNRMGSAVVQARNWRFATLICLNLVVICVIGLIYLGAQPKAVPHIVEVDSMGNVVYQGEIGKTWQNFTPTQAMIKYQLRRFIFDTRSISADTAVLRQNWIDAFALVTDKSAKTLTTYARGNDPLARSKEERVQVEIIGISPLSEKTWQADWKETVWSNKGLRLGTTTWRGIFHITQQQPDEDTLAVNPTGLLIDEFNWSKIKA